MKEFSCLPPDGGPSVHITRLDFRLVDEVIFCALEAGSIEVFEMLRQFDVGN